MVGEQRDPRDHQGAADCQNGQDSRFHRVASSFDYSITILGRVKGAIWNNLAPAIRPSNHTVRGPRSSESPADRETTVTLVPSLLWYPPRCSTSPEPRLYPGPD